MLYNISLGQASSHNEEDAGMEPSGAPSSLYASRSTPLLKLIRLFPAGAGGSLLPHAGQPVASAVSHDRAV